MDLVSRIQEISGRVTLVEVEGDIDFSVSQKLKEELFDVIGAGKNYLVIDLDKVRYIDSSGLEVITSAQSQAMSRHGDVYLVCNDPNIRKIFDITGLDEYIRIFSERDSAFREFPAG